MKLYLMDRVYCLSLEEHPGEKEVSWPIGLDRWSFRVIGKFSSTVGYLVYSYGIAAFVVGHSVVLQTMVTDSKTLLGTVEGIAKRHTVVPLPYRVYAPRVLAPIIIDFTKTNGLWHHDDECFSFAEETDALMMNIS